jgi:hypothetical protein
MQWAVTGRTYSVNYVRLLNSYKGDFVKMELNWPNVKNKNFQH